MLPAGSSTTTTSYALNQGGFVLTSYGYNGSGVGTPLDLYWKGFNGNAGDEHGLGFVGTVDHELTLSTLSTIANFITIDVGAIDTTFTNPQIRVQSTTNGESWDLFGCFQHAGHPPRKTKVLNAQTANNTFISLPNWGTYNYYTLTVHTPGNVLADNVLFDSIQADTGVPEPATWMFLAGGAGLLLLARKRSTRV